MSPRERPERPEGVADGAYPAVTESASLVWAQDELNGANLKFVAINGFNTRYYEAGAGETLVLIHGGQFGSGYSLDCWSLNLRSLAKHYRVLAFDRLGQGWTDNPSEKAAYTAEEVLAHSLGFLRTVGVTSAHLVGHSRGAFVAAWLARQCPDLTRSLVIVDSNTVAPEDPEFPSGQFYRDLERRQASVSTLQARLRMEPSEQCFLQAAVGDDFLRRLVAIAELPKTKEADAVMAVVGEPLWRPSLDLQRRRLWIALERKPLEIPILVLWGADDRSAPLPLGYRLYERLRAASRRCEFHAYSQAKHYLFRDQPLAFEAQIRAFCGESPVTL